MDEKYQHIIQYIRNAAHEFTAAAAIIIRGAISKVAALKFRFVGGAYTKSTIPISTGDSKIITVPLTVDPTKHSHSIASLVSDNMYGLNKTNSPNTIALRTTTNDIHANGAGLRTITNPITGEISHEIETGYKLSNGKDISELFIRSNTSNFTIETINSNPSGNNAIVSMSLTKSGNKFILTNNWGWVCNCSYKLYCQCCD